MSVTIESILRDTQAFLSKKASFIEKKAGIPSDINSMPGSENEKPTDASLANPDKEVASNKGVDGKSTMAPARAYTEQGAKEETFAGKPDTSTADELQKAKVEKPLESADANAKSAAALANDIVANIRHYQETKKSAAAKEDKVPAVASAPATEKPAEKVADKEDKEGTMDGKGTVEKAPDAKPVKSASQPQMELQAILDKMASFLLATDEGANLVERELKKIAGAEAAKETMQFLQQNALDMQKQAAYEAGAADAEALIAQAQQELQKQAEAEAAQPSAEEVAAFEKGASDTVALVQQLMAEQAKPVAKKAAAPVKKVVAPVAKKPVVSKQAAAQSILAKLGQDFAGASMQDLMGAMPPDAAAGAEEVPEMAVEGAPEAGAEGGEGGGEFSLEDIAEAIQVLQQQGEITEEDAAAIMEYLSGAGAEGGEGAEALPEDAAPEAAPEEDAAPAEETVEEPEA